MTAFYLKLGDNRTSFRSLPWPCVALRISGVDAEHQAGADFVDAPQEGWLDCLLDCLLDELAIRRWPTERIAGLADAIDGRRNERIRRVLTFYADEIVIWYSTKTGLLRVNAFAAGLQNDTDRPARDRSCVDEV